MGIILNKKIRVALGMLPLSMLNNCLIICEGITVGDITLEDIREYVDKRTFSYNRDVGKKK